jgi:cytochrome c oxidase subunit III
VTVNVNPGDAVDLSEYRNECNVLDVSKLPDYAFGHRGHIWLGTSLFAIIEGSSVLIAIFVYFYLRRNFDAWPPPRVAPPDLLIGTISFALLLASAIPAFMVHRKSRELDMKGTQLWQVVLAVASALLVVTRAFEFAHLNTRWDEHAYGSAVWVLLGFHTTIFIVDVFDTFVVTALAFIGPWGVKHFSDAEDGAFYWFYTIVLWIPGYIVLYLVPR